MDNGNGNRAITTPTDADIASAIVASLHTTTSRDPSAPPTAQPSWMAFAAMLDKLMAKNPELKREVETAVARTARVSLAAAGAAVPSVEEFVRELNRPTFAARGGTVARAFWWGFHIQISHEDLMNFLGAAEPINAVIGAIGGGVPSPAAPFIALVAAFIAGALGLLRSLDRGNGVYVSMSWFVPGVFIPTSV
jgi:hypothetical protein